LGAQKALEILQSYIVRFLKERIRGEKDGGRGGRGRGRGRPKRGGVSAVGGVGKGGMPAPAPVTAVDTIGIASGPFSTTPLPFPNGVGPPPVCEPESGSGMERPTLDSARPLATDSHYTISALMPSKTISPVLPKSIPVGASALSTGPGHTSESPIIIVDDVDGDEREGPALKKRRLHCQGGAVAI